MEYITHVISHASHINTWTMILQLLPFSYYVLHRYQEDGATLTLSKNRGAS